MGATLGLRPRLGLGKKGDAVRSHARLAEAT